MLRLFYWDERLMQGGLCLRDGNLLGSRNTFRKYVGDKKRGCLCLGALFLLGGGTQMWGLWGKGAEGAEALLLGAGTRSQAGEQKHS